MNGDVLEQSQRMVRLCDFAHALFPVLCYYEGWNTPDQIDYERASSDDWSEDNPALGLWRFMESDLSRMCDYLDAWLVTEGYDLDEVLELKDGEKVFERGTLSRMMASQTKNLVRQSQFDEVMAKILSKQKG